MNKGKKKLNELLLDLQEIRAYRKLQNEPFDFGSGIIRNTSNESEDIYYKREENQIIEQIETLRAKITKDRLSTIDNEQFSLRENHNNKKKKNKKKIPYFNIEKENEETGDLYYTRYCLTKRKKRAKGITNKRMRKYKPYVSFKGSDYKKVYNYWWFVY